MVSELGEEAVLAGAVATSLEAAQERLFDRGGSKRHATAASGRVT